MITPVDSLIGQIAYENQNKVKDAISSLLTSVKSLAPRIGNLIHNDGLESKLVLLTGTIPIYYFGAQYNIPIDLFITERYPNLPPIIFVRPTSSMHLKPQHPNVDSEGKVSIPYLTYWNSTANTLPELIALISSCFSDKPPLFSRPSNNTMIVPQESSSTSSYSSSSYPSSSSAGRGYSAGAVQSSIPAAMPFNAYPMPIPAASAGSSSGPYGSVNSNSNVYAINGSNVSRSSLSPTGPGLGYPSPPTPAVSAVARPLPSPLQSQQSPMYYTPSSSAYAVGTPASAVTAIPATLSSGPRQTAGAVSTVGTTAYPYGAYSTYGSSSQQPYALPPPQQQEHGFSAAPYSQYSSQYSAVTTPVNANTNTGPSYFQAQAQTQQYQQPYQQPYQQQQQQQQSSLSSSSSSSNMNIQMQAQMQMQKQEASRVKRAQLVEEVTRKMKACLERKYCGIRDEIDEEFRTEVLLSKSRDCTSVNTADLTKLKSQLKDALTVVDKKAADLQQWMQEQESNKRAIDVVEDVIVAHDDLTSQIISLNSECLAIDDALYQLQRALLSIDTSNVNVNDYIKETRKLARRQFLCRIHIGKIQASLSAPGVMR